MNEPTPEEMESLRTKWEATRERVQREKQEEERYLAAVSVRRKCDGDRLARILARQRAQDRC